MTRKELKELIRFAKENNLMKESIEKVLTIKREKLCQRQLATQLALMKMAR